MSDAVVNPGTIRLSIGPTEALAAVAEAAELWGGDWAPGSSSGQLVLPVQAGIRHGVVHARVDVTGTESATRLSMVEESSHWRVHTSAAVVLLIALAGALVTVAWPFVPAVRPFLPIGLVLAIGAWLLIVARLQNRGQDEFLQTVEAIAAHGGELPGP